MPSALPDAEADAEAWKTLASSAPDLDPGATLTPAGYAATVRAAPPVMTLPAVTLPELPLLAVGQLHEGNPPSPQGDEGDADFEVTGVLGEGGMGRVLLARQRSLRREVAIKVVKSEHAGAAGIGALLTEAVITGTVEHPSVIPVHLLGRDAAGRPILVMKRVDGVSWRDLARDPDHPLWSVIAPDAGDRLDAHLEILLAVCSAAHAAHARGFVHRDIKLDNVMVGSLGEVYLVDWGIAMRMAAAGDAGLGPRGPRGLVGTPSYMAPEMVRADLAHIDARTDVYLLGATLHAVLTGAPRHRGPSIAEVLLSARDSAPFPYGPEVPAELAALCNRAMAASAADRFSGALELRLALASFRRHRGSLGLSDQAAAQLAAVPATGDASRVHAMLTECRFGFTAALRAWPESPAARAGLERCLARMIEHEILQRDAEGARALLAELRGDHPDLARRIEALEAELRAASERQAELARLERNRDLSVGGGAQLALVGILPVIAAGIFVYMIGRGYRQIPASQIIGVPAGASLILVTAAFLLRRRLDTEISRKAVGMLILILGSVTVHRVLMTSLGAPLAVVFAGDLLLGATVGAGLALTLVPRFGWVSLLCLAGAMAITLRPDRALILFSITTPSMLVLLLLLWRRSVRG